MAKRSAIKVPSIVESEEIINKNIVEIKSNQLELYDSLDNTNQALYTTVEQSKKRLQSVFPAHLKITGRASGKLYDWYKAGDVVEVDIEDVEDLLSKRIGNASCCGASNQGNLLLIVA